MSHRPEAPPTPRSVVRTSQRTRSAPQALARAYELVLPVLRQPVAARPPATRSSPVAGPRVVSQPLAGA